MPFGKFFMSKTTLSVNPLIKKTDNLRLLLSSVFNNFKIGEKKIAMDYWNKAKDLEDTSEFLTLKIKNKTYYE